MCGRYFVPNEGLVGYFLRKDYLPFGVLAPHDIDIDFIASLYSRCPFLPGLKFRCGDIAFRFKADINHYLITIDIHDNTFNNLSIRKRLYRIIIRFLKRFRTHRLRRIFRCSRCLFRQGCFISGRWCFLRISINLSNSDFRCFLRWGGLIGKRWHFLRISIANDYFYRFFGVSLISLLGISIVSSRFLFTTRDFLLSLNICISC